MLVDAITDYAIYMLSPDGLVTSWNAGAQRFKGYTAAEIIGEHFSRFYTPEDRESGLPARALNTAATTGHYETEGWRLRKDGTRFWTHAIIDAIRDSDGDLVGFAKITRDLTERKRAERELKSSEEQFRILVQGVTDYAIFMLDPRGIVTSWNAGAERIKRYRADEIVGRHFSRFYTEEDRAAGEPQLALSHAETEGRWEREGWRVRKDGSRFMAHVVIDAIRDESSELVGFAKVTRDVTERVTAQKNLELAREALFQSQKLEAVGKLTGGIAHDFNNLLAAVIGGLELLRKRLPDDPRTASLLENTLQAAQRGTALTQRMLAFARRQELKVSAVDLQGLVDGMLDLLRRSLGPTIAMDLRFSPRLPPILSDPNQVEAAILNLVVNARDAMGEHGRITIAAEEKAVIAGSRLGLKPGRYVRLSVHDTGSGMDAETLARAAEPFFTTKGIGRGTGLGLSMVHGLAEQSGGRLYLHSRLGQGTTADVWFPVADDLSPSAPPVVRETMPTAAGRLLTVLVVDDDPLVLSSTIAFLEDLGHRALEADSASTALAILDQGQEVDVLLTDQAMPGTTGSQLAKVIKARWPGLPIVMATGFSELADGEHVFDARLSKPFSQDELAAVLASVGGSPAVGR